MSEDGWLTTRIAELERENRILLLKTSGTLATNLCPDHRDKQAGLPCLACTIETLKREVLGRQKECHEVAQILGRVLGYRPICEDQKNFPGTTEADGVCIGDHVPSSIAMEAAGWIKDAAKKISALSAIDGYAVVTQDGSFVGIWRTQEAAEVALTRSPAAKNERIQAMAFVKQDNGARPGAQGRFTAAEFAIKEFPR